MRSKELIEEWVKGFNEGGAEKIASSYHSNAINHQVANDPVVGKAAIYKMLKNEFG